MKSGWAGSRARRHRLKSLLSISRHGEFVWTSRRLPAGRRGCKYGGGFTWRIENGCWCERKRNGGREKEMENKCAWAFDSIAPPFFRSNFRGFFSLLDVAPEHHSPRDFVQHIKQNRCASLQMAPASCALLSDVPIVRYRECFKSLIAFNPDELRGGSMASPLQTHTEARSHKRRLYAPTRSLAILVWRLKPYKRGETKVTPPSFKWEEHGLTKWAGELQENKRGGPRSVWWKQSSGQRGWGAGPLIKRIIWRRTARGRGCPCPEMEYSNETHHWQLRESEREIKPDLETRDEKRGWV